MHFTYGYLSTAETIRTSKILSENVMEEENFVPFLVLDQIDQFFSLLEIQ